MVDIHVNDNNNQIRINVNPTSNSVSSTIGNEAFYNGLAKEWAISPELVQGEDYSAKHYAQLAKISEDIARQSIDSENKAQVWAEGTDEEVQALGGEHSSKGWVDYVIENAPTASVAQTAEGATLTVTDIHGTTTATILNGAKGDKGDTGAQGEQGPQGLQGIQGPQGVSIVSNELYSSSGLYDTYRQTFSDGSHFDYVVKNGEDGAGTVTDVQVNGTSVLSGGVASITVPTDTVDLTNNAGFIKSSDLPTNHVTTDTDQNITGTKTFVGQKKIAFKQSGTSDKLGFTLYNNSGTEKGYLEYNPSNNVDGVPLMTLGNYATASGGLTHVGFRKYSSISGSSGAYNLLTPLISDAKTPFSLTTTYTNFYLPLGFTDGNTTIKTAKSGMVDLSSIIPTATSDLTNDSGFITSIPTATSGTLGIVQPDNTTITIDSNGVISSNGASRNVGEVITSTLPLTDAGLHLLDGTLLQYGIYKEFIDYIADLYTANPTANYFTDETTWQNSVTQYGSCGKFVYDSVSKTVRLPKISDILQSTTDINALGDLIEAGLPNITGYKRTDALDPTNIGGCFYTSRNESSGAASGGSSFWRQGTFNFDASRSSSIYGNSSTVQPQAIKVLYYIVLATSTKTDIQVDIDNIATDLNGKADTDLTNVTDTGKILMSEMGMPSDKYIDLTLGSSGSTYTAPANGYYNIGYDAGTDCYVSLRSSGLETSRWQQSNWAALFLPVNKGRRIVLDYRNVTFRYFRFTYAEGSKD